MIWLKVISLLARCPLPAEELTHWLKDWELRRHQLFTEAAPALPLATDNENVMDHQIPISIESEIPKEHLLIVDDDPVISRIFGIALERLNYQISFASSGEDCLAMLETLSPALILLDIEMPNGINGYDTCSRIRERFDSASLTIIFMSGHDTLEERIKAYDAGGGMISFLKLLNWKNCTVKSMSPFKQGKDRESCSKIIKS